MPCSSTVTDYLDRLLGRPISRHHRCIHTKVAMLDTPCRKKIHFHPNILPFVCQDFLNLSARLHSCFDSSSTESQQYAHYPWCQGSAFFSDGPMAVSTIAHAMIYVWMALDTGASISHGVATTCEVK
jgi:hypothetical protein